MGALQEACMLGAQPRELSGQPPLTATLEWGSHLRRRATRQVFPTKTTPKQWEFSPHPQQDLPRDVEPFSRAVEIRNGAPLVAALGNIASHKSLRGEKVEVFVPTAFRMI
jgi:hypothetical protein